MRLSKYIKTITRLLIETKLTMKKLISALLGILFFGGFNLYAQQCKTVNLAAGRPQNATFSSSSPDNYEPYRAFDVGTGSDQTHWGYIGTQKIQELGIDLGGQYNICSFEMVFDPVNFPSAFNIRATNDYSSWTTLQTVTGNTSSSPTVYLPATTNQYSVVEILFIDYPAGATGYVLYDCKIHPYNQLPDPTITAPAAGMNYISGQNVEITATATDADGSIAKVEFYQGTTLIGQSTVSPYTITWTNPAVGAYDITAKAYDNEGGTNWSDAVHITVSAAPTSLKNWSLNGTVLSNNNTGYVAIGSVPGNVPTSDAELKLTVNGTIYAKKLTVTRSLWPDYVFADGYKLRSLGEVERYIATHHHLPDVPSQARVSKEGLNVGDGQAVLLQKIEELTLYVIDQNKRLAAQDKKLSNLQLQVKQQSRTIRKLTARN